VAKQFLKNIEKTRNTEEQLDYYKQLSKFVEESDLDQLEKVSNFPIFSTRQTITCFMEKYEIYKLIKNIPGSIVECGVAAGFGLMSFMHFSSIFEPYHYVRKVIGFDTFEGFTKLSAQDKSSKADHMIKGGIKYASYDILKDAVEIHNKNRVLGHIAKVQLVKGDISKTLPKFLTENPSLVIAMLYLDLDLYQPTLDTIKLLVDRVPKGGIIAFDELNHADYPGETTAVLETIGIRNLKLERFDFSAMLSYARIE